MKAAQIFMADPLPLELARGWIRVTVVSPSSILSEGGGWTRAGGPSRRSSRPASASGSRGAAWGHREEVANVVVTTDPLGTAKHRTGARDRSVRQTE